MPSKRRHTEERTAELVESNGRLRAELAERERVIESLMLRNHRLTAIFDYSFHFVGLLGADGTVHEINRTAVDFAGVQADAVIGRKFWELDWWQRSTVTSEQVRRATMRASRGRIVRFEAGFADERGTVIDFILTPLRDASGHVTQIIPEGRDVTRGRRAERALRESEDRFRKSFDHAPIGMALVALDGAWTRVNAALCEILGMSERELLTVTIRGSLAGEDLVRYDAAVDRLLRGSRRTIESDVRFLRADGTRVWAHLSIALVRSEKGSPLYFVAHVQNIEARRRSEEMMREAIEAAEEANRIKSEFVAATSHEIRTPLNAIIGMTGLLLDTALAERQREFTEIIRKSGESLLSIINDVLDLSKVESGKLELDLQPFDLRACVEDSVELVASRAAEKQIELLWSISPMLPARLIGDVTRVQQVLANLLANAVKFTERGEVTVEVRRGRREDRMLEVVFAVRDTGIGIDQTQMPRLFERFSQVDSSTTRRHGGTGLGLAISKRLVEAMGGRIWVESSPGFGSTFSFTLITQPAAERAAPSTLDSSTLEGRGVLVVIEHPAVRSMVVEQLETWGLRPAVMSAADALTILAAGARFDLALVDAAVGDGDTGGIEIVRRVRASGAAGGLPTLLLCSPTQEDLRRTAEGLDGVIRLLKPVRQSQLFDGLMTALNPTPDAVPGRAVVPMDTPAAALPLSILLAEDNVVNQRVALLMLEGLGYRADVAGNGLEAVDALRRQHYDIVLMDVQMPELDGLEATRRIRAALGPDRQPWVIAMTASAIDGFDEVCYDAGMNDFVAKPVRRDGLAEAIRRAGDALLGEGIGVQDLHADAAGDEPRTPSSVPASATSPEAAVDREILQALMDDLAANIAGAQREIIEDYIGNARHLVESIRASADEGRWPDARRFAHSLKSSSAWVGALRLASLCRDMETCCGQGAVADWPARVEELGAELELVATEMASIAKPPDSGS